MKEADQNHDISRHKHIRKYCSVRILDECRSRKEASFILGPRGTSFPSFKGSSHRSHSSIRHLARTGTQENLCSISLRWVPRPPRFRLPVIPLVITITITISQMKIIVVRHGHTAMNQLRIFQPYETPLSDLGRKQAELCGQELFKRFKINKILTSDLLRARQTVQCMLSTVMSDPGKNCEFLREMNSEELIATAERNGIEIVVSELLRERDFGDLKGSSYASIDPEMFQLTSEYLPPNGESWGMFHKRVEESWKWVLSHVRSGNHRKEDVVEEVTLVVTHGLVKTSLAEQFFGTSVRVPFENTSVSIVSRETPHVVYELNSVKHLGTNEHQPSIHLQVRESKL
jgi:broad specificity phosphatase PhoE